MSMNYADRVKLTEDLIKSIKLNIEDKCPFLSSKGKCEFGCWNCMLSAAAIETLELHAPQEGTVTCKQLCDDTDDDFLCKTTVAFRNLA